MGDLTDKLTWLRTRWFFIIFLLVILFLLIFETINVLTEGELQRTVQAYVTKDDNYKPNEPSNTVNIDLTKNP